MRKISTKRKQYLDKWSRLSPLGPRAASTLRGVKLERPEPDRIFAPREFNLGEQAQRTTVLTFIKAFRRRLLRPTPQKFTLDFSRVAKLYADATLLFYAELRRMLRHSAGRHSVGCVLPENEKACQVFDQIGLCSLMGVASPVAPSDDDVVHWRFAFGHRVDGERYEDVLADYDGEIAEDIQEALFTGITEAMTNVINHAYVLPREDGCGIQDRRDWWMFSHLRDELLVVVICDLGAGIPRTLPMQRRELWQKLLRTGRTGDASAIENAVKDSRSRTGLDHRGKGLGQIYKAAIETAGSQVAIFSNAGVFGRSLGGRTLRKNYTDSILGTLIHWNIPLPSKEHQ